MIKQYGYFKLVHFSEKSGPLSSAGPENLAFGRHCTVKFEPILDCFIPNFKLKYGESENFKKIVSIHSFSNYFESNRGSFYGIPGISSDSLFNFILELLAIALLTCENHRVVVNKNVNDSFIRKKV